MYVIVAVPADPHGKGRTILDPLTWLLIPLATVFMASVWSCCAGRSRRSDVWSDVQRYDQVRAALERAANSEVPVGSASRG